METDYFDRFVKRMQDQGTSNTDNAETKKNNTEGEKTQMETKMQIFENAEFGSVRSVVIDGEPWFVGKDVATALGYKEPTKAARELVDSEDKGVSILDTPGGKQVMTIINESGMYSLIMGSKLPNAKRFKRWVTSEVLPALRKTKPQEPQKPTESEQENQKNTSKWEETQEMETKMQICGSEITVKEYNGERVVTLADVDTVHQRVQGTARRNFNENRNKLVEGVDYYQISEPYEIRTLGLERKQGGLPESITLLTESGYLMLVKSLRDDLAWMVQRELVNGYFRLRRVAEAVKQAKEPEDDFTTVCRALQITNKHLQRLQSRNSELECRNEALEAQIERDKPLTEFAKAVQASDDCIYVAELATHLTQHGFPVSEYKLFRLLRELKYLKSVKGAEWNKPAQKGKDLGLFWLNETHREVNGKERVFQTTMVTQKGLRYFLDFFCGKN